MVFDANWQLNRHTADSHSKLVYACSFCAKSYRRKPSLNRHMRTHHPKELECVPCAPIVNTSKLHLDDLVPEPTALSKSAQIAVDMELSPHLRISEIADLELCLGDIADFGRLSARSMLSEFNIQRHSTKFPSDKVEQPSLRRSTINRMSRTSQMDRSSLFSLLDGMDRTSHGSVMGLISRGSVDHLDLVAEIMGEDASDITPGRFLSCDSTDSTDIDDDYIGEDSPIRYHSSKLKDQDLMPGGYEEKLAQTTRTSLRVSINPGPTKRMALCP